MSSTYIPRFIVPPGRAQFGWYPGVAWWDFSCPGNGLDDATDWAKFSTAQIYKVDEGFLAIDHGCHTKNGTRLWEPKYSVFPTLDAAMDFCENGMRSRGLF